MVTIINLSSPTDPMQGEQTSDCADSACTMSCLGE